MSGLSDLVWISDKHIYRPNNNRLVAVCVVVQLVNESPLSLKILGAINDSVNEKYSIW